MSKKFTDNTTKTTAAATDWVPIVDVSSSTDKKTSVAGLASAVAANLPNASVTPSMLSTGAQSSLITSSQTTSSTTYAALATAQAVTVTVGANGLLWIALGAGTMRDDTGSAKCFMSVALSGANTRAAADDIAAKFQSASANVEGTASRTVLLTGLTPGSTTVTAQFKVEDGGGGAGTGTWVNRSLAVEPR